MIKKRHWQERWNFVKFLRIVPKNSPILDMFDLNHPIKVLYKTNESLLLQLFEVLSQKSSELVASFWKYLSNIESSPEAFKTNLGEAVKLLKASEYLSDAPSPKTRCNPYEHN